MFSRHKFYELVMPSGTGCDEMTRRLVDEFQPEQVILFGSHAWGTPSEDSDVDVLVIVSASDLTPTERAARAYRCLRGVKVPKDILVKTRAEAERYRHVPAARARIVRKSGSSSGARYSMSDAKHELVRLWLLKAQRDLAAAQKIASGKVYLPGP